MMHGQKTIKLLVRLQCLIGLGFTTFRFESQSSLLMLPSERVVPVSNEWGRKNLSQNTLAQVVHDQSKFRVSAIK
jgi:hypothetical protein